MTRRLFPHPAPPFLVRIATVAVVALLVLGGGYGVAHFLVRPGGQASPTATPVMLAGGDAPATPVAGGSATPAVAVGGDRASGSATMERCAGPGAAHVENGPQHLAAPGRAIVTVGALNLRAGPGTDCPIVGSLGFGMQVTIAPELIKAGDHYWRRVTTPVGEGYTVASSYQNLPKVAPAGVPVLMYHHISDGDDKYYVTPAEFERQVSWLKEHGFVSITPTDLYHAMYHGLALPAKPVMLTIDDGYPSTRTFKQILDKYEFRGVYFLPDYAQLSDAEIRTLAASGEVCGHTVGHPDLATLSYDDQYAEIVNNKRYLEKIIGRPVTCFGYPFGSYNDVTDQIIAQSGYKLAFDAWGGSAVISPEANQFHVLRYGVYSSYSWETFLAIVRQQDGAPS